MKLCIYFWECQTPTVWGSVRRIIRFVIELGKWSQTLVEYEGGLMTDYVIRPTQTEEGPKVRFGPEIGLGHRPLEIPLYFRRAFEYASFPFSLELTFSFDGDRVQITRLLAESKTGHIASRDLTQLSLPAVTRDAARAAVTEPKFWSGDFKGQAENKNTDFHFLAQLYWFEHVTGGSPRLVIQDFLGCKRTTANYYIRLVGSQFALPGVHKKDV